MLLVQLFVALSLLFSPVFIPLVDNGEGQPPITVSHIDPVVQATVDLVNAERGKLGVAPLTLDPQLVGFAQAWSTHMADTGEFAHQQLVPIFAFGYYRAGETIASGYPTPAEVVDGWMHSPPHHDILMDPHYTHLGVGVDRQYWTIDVGGK